MPTIRINIPSPVKQGEIIEIKTMIMHPMETGFRVDSMAKPYPKRIIHTFECLYNGEEVVRMELNSGIAAKPLITFIIEAVESGELLFRWHDDNGEVYTKTGRLDVL